MRISKFPNDNLDDHSVRAQSEGEMKGRIRRRATILAELGKAALRGETISFLMEKIVIDIAEVLDAEFCKILQLLPDRNSLLLCAGVGWKDGLVGKTTVPTGSESQAGYTLLTEDPVIVEDFASETRFIRPQLLKMHDVISGISIIIQGVSRPWGILGVHSKYKRSYSQDDVDFVQAMSNILAEAIERKTYVEELKQSEEKFRGLLETAPNGIVISNANGEIEIVNKHLEKMSGYHRGELIGRHVEVLVPTRFSRHHIYRREFLQKPQTKVMGERTHELFLMCKDGSELPVEISLAPLETAGGTIISAVIRDITERKRSELQNLQSQKRLRNLAQRLQAAREEERTTVARDIHDELGQTLTGLKMDLSWLLVHISGKSKDLVERIQTMIALVESTINFVRRLSTSLRPAILDDLGLAAAIEWQIEGFASRTGCSYTLRLDHENIDTENNRDTNIFRIFQEALTNVARHARADKVEISLHNVGGQLILSVIDNGIGIAQEKLTDNLSLGLIGMHERASTIGGTLEVEAGKDGGTRITLKVPMTVQVPDN